MFKAFTVSYDNLPSDVSRHIFGTGEIDYCDDYLYEDYLVVQVDGKTIFCKPESGLSEGLQMVMDLMELSYYLGVLDGIKHEQSYMGGKNLKALDAGKHQSETYTIGTIISVSIDPDTEEVKYFKNGVIL